MRAAKPIMIGVYKRANLSTNASVGLLDSSASSIKTEYSAEG